MEVALAEFDLAQLRDLHVGDVIEVPPLLSGLDPDEAVVGMVSAVDGESISLRFTYHGVWIGTFRLNFKENKWSRALAVSRT
jgi:hypothetical protein